MVTWGKEGEEDENYHFWGPTMSQVLYYFIYVNWLTLTVILWGNNYFCLTDEETGA